MFAASGMGGTSSEDARVHRMYSSEDPVHTSPLPHQEMNNLTMSITPLSTPRVLLGNASDLGLDLTLSSSTTPTELLSTPVVDLFKTLCVFPEWHLFLTLAGYILFSRFISYFFYLAKIPRLVGDVLAGCLLGPTLFPEAVPYILPREMRQVIRILGDLGLIFSSLVAGLNFDRRLLRGQYLSCLGYTLLNCGLPTLLSIPLFYVLPSEWSEEKPAAFFAILAMTMMTTALPFCYLILEELGVTSHSVGKFIIGFAFPSTITCFTALSIGTSLAVEHPYGTIGLILFRFGGLTALCLACMAMHLIWNKLIATCHGKWMKAWPSRVTTDLMVFIISGSIVCGVITARLQYSSIPGAFVWGACMPFNDPIRNTAAAKVKWFSRWFLLPFYFLGVGTSFDLRTLKLATAPYVFLVAACGALFKFAVAPFGRLFFDLTWREAWFCATLGDTRGFSVLVAGVTGVELGVFGQDMFSACVIMTLLTNFLAGPLGRIFVPLPEDDSITDSGSESDNLSEPGADTVSGLPPVAPELSTTSSFTGRRRSTTHGGHGHHHRKDVGYTLPGEPPLHQITLEEEHLDEEVRHAAGPTAAPRILFAEEILGRFGYFVCYQRGTKDDPLAMGKEEHQALHFNSQAVHTAVHEALPEAVVEEDIAKLPGRHSGSGKGSPTDASAPSALPGGTISPVVAPGGVGLPHLRNPALDQPGQPSALEPYSTTALSAMGPSFSACSPGNAQCTAGPVTFTGAELIAWMALGEAYTGTDALDTANARFAYAERSLSLRLIRPYGSEEASGGHSRVATAGDACSAAGSGHMLSFQSVVKSAPDSASVQNTSNPHDDANPSAAAAAAAAAAAGAPPGCRDCGDVELLPSSSHHAHHASHTPGHPDKAHSHGHSFRRANAELFSESSLYVLAPFVPLVRPLLSVHHHHGHHRHGHHGHHHRDREHGGHTSGRRRAGTHRVAGTAGKLTYSIRGEQPFSSGWRSPGFADLGSADLAGGRGRAPSSGPLSHPTSPTAGGPALTSGSSGQLSGPSRMPPPYPPPQA